MREAEAHLALPTKQERNEAKFLREQLERNEAEFKAEQQRAKLTVDRLRQQIVDLTNEISELRMEKGCWKRSARYRIVCKRRLCRRRRLVESSRSSRSLRPRVRGLG